jgi:BirA family transcriptional regulator, biotin operon repressor / biotin---[acetyl-CoA-carboxylase] ligase
MCFGMPNFTVHQVERIDSTNTQLMHWAARQNCHRVVLVADEQTAGRGQRGRKWQATAGDALLCSVGWQFARGCPLDGLSLAVGLMVADALGCAISSQRAERLRLKWPNDLLVDEAHKLGGILIETVASAGNTRTAVIGIGVNLNAPRLTAVPGGLPAIGLNEVDRAGGSRDHVLNRVLAEIDNGLTDFATYGFAHFQERWWVRSAYRGVQVRARLPDGETILGYMQSVTSRGALVIESERGLHTLVSGEVSLRVASS